ncbi:MAG TPA: hypothetical protein VI759_09300 [Dehalococcoidia bacterium]|nr:hypothetical protein [Dehalococcoidia bacterium]
MADAETRDIETVLEGVRRHSRRVSDAAAFRATIEARLRGLETEVSEVKTRLNGLLFSIAATVIAQVLLKVLS